MKFEKDHHGCIWGILHLFNVHQRLHMPKMLSNKKHGVERHAAGGIRIPIAKSNSPSTIKEHKTIDSDFLVEDDIYSPTKASGKACMRELMDEEMSKEQVQTQRIPDFSSRLMRTLSIHHLECNDYVHPDDMTDKGDASRAILHPHDTCSSASSKHMPLLPIVPFEANYGEPCEVCGNINPMEHNQLEQLGNIFLKKQVLRKEELNDVEDGFLEKLSVDDKALRKDGAYYRTKNILDALISFNTSREVYIKTLHEPNSVVLSKSSSFPMPGFLGKAAKHSKRRHKRKQSESVSMQEEKIQAGKAPSISNTESQESGSRPVASIIDDKVGESNPDQIFHIAGSEGNYESRQEFIDGLKDNRDDGATRIRFKNIKDRIKEVIRKSRKEGHRISRDGILHKIPYGFEASQDLKGERPDTWENRESTRSNHESEMIFTSNNKHAHRTIRRCRSLTESLDRYSQLFESTLGQDPLRHKSEKPELAHEASVLQFKDPLKTLGRIFSLPEVHSYFPGNDDQSTMSSDVFHSRTSWRDLVESNAAFEDYGFEKKSVSSLINTEGHADLGIGMENASLEHAMENNATSTVDADQHFLDDKRDGIGMHSEPAKEADEHVRCTSLHEKETRSDMDHSDRPGTPSPISVLNSYFREDPIGSTMFSASEGSELTPRNIPLELDSLADPEDWSATDATNVMETIVADTSEVEILSKHSGIDTPHVQVDWDNGSDFDYVINILKKSGLGNEESLGTWYSNQPVDPSLFLDMECSLCEDDLSRYGSDINIAHLLLFDLINEALLEIYERSSALCPQIQFSDSQIRPIPMGRHVLEEVWANISWHLNSQPQQDPTLEYVVGRDFTKNDGWMKLQTERECVGLELETLILDDLFDRVIIDFLDLPSHSAALS